MYARRSSFVRACIINWVGLQNSRDMLPPLQIPRSATGREEGEDTILASTGDEERGY